MTSDSYIPANSGPSFTSAALAITRIARTGERIRDKIAASKRKGMWMGGVPPLGYDVENLTTLAPDIVAAILDDAMPNHVTLFDLAVDPPALWDDQRARLR